jgi:very-short-patch-repair endonuclease
MADAHARALRKAMTVQEVKLWVRLRALRAQGFHFRRQAPRDGYILDFVCLRNGIIVEVDGGQHGMNLRSAADRQRDAHFAGCGFKILRFWNSDVDENLDGVVETIARELRTDTIRRNVR